MIALTSKGEPYRIKGWGLGYTVTNPGVEEPTSLTDTKVLLDGKEVKVKGVETYAIARPYPKTLDFAVVVGCCCEEHTEGMPFLTVCPLCATHGDDPDGHG